mgnify:CR=1 FL=1
MFGLDQIVKYLTFISYIGFFISSISGFIAVSNTFDLCKLNISIIVLINVPLFFYIELFKFQEADETIKYYFRAYNHILISLLILGLSHIGLGFGIYGIILVFANLLLGVFEYNSSKIQPTMNNPNESPENA